MGPVGSQDDRAHVRLAFLAETSRFLADLDLARGIGAAAAATARDFVDACAIDLATGDKARAGFGRTTRECEPVVARIVEPTLRGGVTLAGSRALDGLAEPIVLETMKMLRKMGFAAAVSVPVRAEGQIAGALVALACDDCLTALDLFVLEDFARRIGSALRLHGALRRALDTAREREFRLAETVEESRVALERIVASVQTLASSLPEAAPARDAADELARTAARLVRRLEELGQPRATAQWTDGGGGED